MKVYCINLLRRPDRWAAFTKTYTAAGLSLDDLTRFDAIDGRYLNDEHLAMFRLNPRSAKKNKQGRAACFLSHVGVIETALRADSWPAMVFEDDVTIDKRIHEAIESRPEADILYLGALPVQDRKRVALGHTGWAKTSVKLYGGHAYMLPNREAAERLLDFIYDHVTVFDTALTLYQREHAAPVYYPFVVKRTFGDSDIDVA